MDINNLNILGKNGLGYLIIDTLSHRDIVRFLNQYGVYFPGHRIEKLPIDILADSLAEKLFDEPNQEILRYFEKSAQSEIEHVRTMDNKALQTISRRTKKFLQTHTLGKILFALACDARKEAHDQIPLLLNKAEKILDRIQLQNDYNNELEIDKIEDIKSKVEKLLVEYEQLQKSLIQEQQKVEGLKNEREGLRKQLADLANKKGVLQKENEKLTREISTLQSEIENLKKQLTLHQRDRETIRNLEKENKRLIYELEKIKTSDASQQFILMLKTLLEQLQREWNLFRNEIREYNQELLSNLRELDREIKGIKPFITRLGKDKESGEIKLKRIGLFVDTQNIFYSAKDYYQGIIDYEKLKNYVVRGRILTKAIAYTVSASDFDQTNFINYLNRLGFEIRNRPLIVRSDGSKKGNVDVDIATDVLNLAESFDILALVSGDGDFVPLLTHLKAKGKKVEVYNFPETTSTQLQQICDEFYPLGSEIVMKKEINDKSQS